MYIAGVKSDIDNIWVSNGHGSLLLSIFTELRKYGYQSVFDTLVVHTVNTWMLYYIINII